MWTPSDLMGMVYYPTSHTAAFIITKFSQRIPSIALGEMRHVESDTVVAEYSAAEHADARYLKCYSLSLIGFTVGHKTKFLNHTQD
jgi:hypothetical protein